MKLTFVTGNINKAELLSKSIGFEIGHRNIELTEIQSLDLEEIITHKAKEAYTKIGSPVLVHDTALYFKALGHLPGPFIKWFLESIGNKGLCKLVDGYNNRQATAVVMLGYYDGQVLKIFQEKLEGEVAETPRGEKGFGWDPVFIPRGYNKTRAELDESEYSQNSLTEILAKQANGYFKQNKLYGQI